MNVRRWESWDQMADGEPSLDDCGDGSQCHAGPSQCGSPLRRAFRNLQGRWQLAPSCFPVSVSFLWCNTTKLTEPCLRSRHAIQLISGSLPTNCTLTGTLRISESPLCASGWPHYLIADRQWFTWAFVTKQAAFELCSNVCHDFSCLVHQQRVSRNAGAVRSCLN
jgi:hypothetical protein